jgi:hypothetical protein
MEDAFLIMEIPSSQAPNSIGLHKHPSRYPLYATYYQYLRPFELNDRFEEGGT